MNMNAIQTARKGRCNLYKLISKAAGEFTHTCLRDDGAYFYAEQDYGRQRGERW